MVGRVRRRLRAFGRRLRRKGLRKI